MRLRIMLRTEKKMEVSQWAVGCRWMIKENFQQETRKSRSEMQKDSKTVWCTLLNGSVWCTERKHTRRYTGTFDIFFGTEHRMRKEEMEEQVNKEAKQGWRFAVDAARITDESASNLDRKHTSGRVVCGGRQQSWSSYWQRRRGSYVDSQKQRKNQLPKQVIVRGSMRVFAVY